MRIKEFAKLIGVSPTTVSHVLSGRGRVSAKTREMVLRRMRELGYTPNPHAQQLVTGRSHIIALHHTDQEILSDLFLTDFARGVQSTLHMHGYGLLLDNVFRLDSADSPLLRWVRSAAIDGVILIKGWSPVREHIKQLANPATPFVIYGAPTEADLPYVGCITTDMKHGVEAVADLLVSLGHRRVGFIGTREDDLFPTWFREALKKYGVPLEERNVVTAGFTVAEGATAARHLLTQPNPPTAIFARKDDLAIGAMFSAVSLGRRVPEQVSIVGHDDVPMASMMEPPLTTVRIDAFGLGQRAAEMVLALRRSPGEPIQICRFQTSLVIRKSTGPAPCL